MPRALLLGLGAVGMFAVVAGIMILFMPRPLRESDYMVIGSVATLISLLMLFLVLVPASMKSSDIFFKRRKK